jgi:putative DNA primase/helicase
MISERLVSMRILGLSEVPTFENTATAFANGNNITVAEDMVRRTIGCRLDIAMERPELRKFAFSPTGLVLANRGAYVAAALTIARAYRVAGHPDVGCSPFASFEQWTSRVRAPLVWLGQDDPVASMDTLRDKDPGLAIIREFFEEWEKRMAMDVDYTAAEMVETTINLNYPTLRNLLIRAYGGDPRNAPDIARVGRWLGKIEGRVVDGKRLVIKLGRSSQYRLETVEDER